MNIEYQCKSDSECAICSFLSEWEEMISVKRKNYEY